MPGEAGSKAQNEPRDSTRTCTVCATEFEVCFRYQVESGTSETEHRYFCSQRCLEASHTGKVDGSVKCDACAKSFQVELAAQVLFTGGRRHYACGPECRTRVLAGVRAVRLGELSDPRYLPEDTLVTPTAPTAASATPTPPPASVVRTNRAPERQAGPRVIAVFNQKGGTAKTTTAVHVAAGLARAGHRVLLVDTDGQGNAGASLGVRPDRTLYHVLVMGLPFSDAVVEVRDGLHVLPANETLAAAELYLSGQRQRDRILANRLAGARAAYEYVIVDCSPSLSLMNQNALVFADAVLCPVACDFLSLYGVRQVVRTVKQINRLLGHSLVLWGVLPTLYDARARICREALETLRNTFGDACLDPVHFAIRAKEAPAQGKTLFEYAPTSPAAADYARVVARIRGERETTLREAAGGSA
jgi:chromosome partitioning protein